MLYFKFKEEKTSKPETDKKQSVFWKLADAFLKMLSSNPDFEEYRDKICSWYIEYDDVEYEYFIGFDDIDDADENDYKWKVFARVSVNRETGEVTVLDYKLPNGKRMENPIKPTSFA